MQAETQFFWYESHLVLHQFSLLIPLGGLFSFLKQKSASKVLKTGYFAYFLGQWGTTAPLPPPLATLLLSLLIVLVIW